MKFISALFIFLSLFFTNLYAQDLHLTSGNRSKTIKVGTCLDVEVPVSNQGIPYYHGRKYLIGRLVSYENGIMKMKMITSQNRIQERTNMSKFPYTEEELANGMRMVEIPHDSILSITKKGIKKRRKYTTGGVVGQVLTTFGVSHLLSAPVAEIQEDNTGGLFLFLGLGEVVTGSALISIFRQKPIYTNEIWAFNKAGRKVWELN